MKEILDLRAIVTSDPVFVLIGILAIVVVGCVYNSNDKILNLIWTVKIKQIERQIHKQTRLIKKTLNPSEIMRIESLLLSLFWIYETKVIQPVLITRLFPREDESLIRGVLNQNELRIKGKLISYYEMSTKIDQYRKAEYGGISLTELIEKL